VVRDVSMMFGVNKLSPPSQLKKWFQIGVEVIRAWICIHNFCSLSGMSFVCSKNVHEDLTNHKIKICVLFSSWWVHFGFCCCRWRSQVAWPVSQLWLQCCGHDAGRRLWRSAGTVDCARSSWPAYVWLWHKVMQTVGMGTLLRIHLRAMHVGMYVWTRGVLNSMWQMMWRVVGVT